MRKAFFTFLLTASLTVSLSAFGQTVKISANEKKMAETITAAQLKNYLYFVASDAMEGRDTPSRGLDVTAEFLKLMVSSWGFKPAGDGGTFFQTLNMHRDVINSAETTAEIAGQKLVHNTDFLATPAAGKIENARMVFAGNGWFVKSKGLEPLKDIDAKGRIVIIYAENAPRGVTFPELFASGRQGEDWADPVTYAKQKGAAGLIIIGSANVQKNWEALKRQREKTGYVVDKLVDAQASFPSIFISTRAGEELLRGESSNLANVAEIFAGTAPMPTFELSAGKTASITVAITAERAKTQNVVALWEGSDPVLKKEMIAIGAHYDHDGVRANAPGDDKIWNGADDDGSGTVAVLAVAEALAKAKIRPKRSVLLVWHAGEEKGLLGSEYFNKFPTIDIKNVITQLNIDMIGRSQDPNNIIKCDRPGKPCNEELSKADEIYVIGSEMMSSTLGAITKGTNSGFLNLSYNYKYDDPKDKNRFFFRSDHFHYAVNNIPIVFWFDGVHEDYHQSTDTPDKIDYAKMEKVTRTIFLTLWKVSELKERPKVDKQLPPELTRR